MNCIAASDLNLKSRCGKRWKEDFEILSHPVIQICGEGMGEVYLTEVEGFPSVFRCYFPVELTLTQKIAIDYYP